MKRGRSHRGRGGNGGEAAGAFANRAAPTAAATQAASGRLAERMTRRWMLLVLVVVVGRRPVSPRRRVTVRARAHQGPSPRLLTRRQCCSLF